MSIDFSFLMSGVFWTATGVIVALVTLVVTLLKGARWRYLRLQSLLNRERGFYDAFPAFRAEPDPESQEGMAFRYFDAVASGLSGVEDLPIEVRRQAEAKLSKLISELRRSHQTLVGVLEIFSSTDVKHFFESLNNTISKLSTVYHGGKITSDARTHCSEVERTVREICSGLSPDPLTVQRIRDLGSAVVVQDREVIVPLMRSILDKTQVELALLAQAVRERDRKRAIQLKEKYWFDVKYTYGRIRAGLDKMHHLSEALAREVTAQRSVATKLKKGKRGRSEINKQP